MTAAAAITVTGLEKSYGDVQVLRGVDSSADVGSSASTRRGRWSVARMSATFWRMPFEKVPSQRSPASVRSNMSSRSSIRLRRASGAMS